MQRVEFMLVRSRTPKSNPETLFQLVAAANHRVTILGADISLQGNTPANAPVVFQWFIQTDAGVFGTDPTTLTPQKNDRGYDEAIQTTFNAYDGESGGPPATPDATEPTGTTKIAEFSIHEQGIFPWTPRFSFVVKGGERVGFKYARATFVPVSVTLYCTE